MLNVVFLFLLFIAVLGVMGKLRLIKPGGRTKLPRPRKCRACGRFILGSRGCDCGGKS